MVLNLKEIKLFEMVHDSTKSSYIFLKKHPFVSCALLFCIIVYMFLSYIYSFLAYLSPFLFCAAIFVRIFWSSEQTQFKYVKREEEKAESRKPEQRLPRIPNNRRSETLHKYPSQNATSRRRNFKGKIMDVYGGLEEKAKDLSAVFHNEYTARNHTRSRGSSRSFDKGESSSGQKLSTGRNQPPRRHQMLRSELSMRDLVEANGNEIKREKMDDADDEDEYETQDEKNKAVVEWTEDDQRNVMDLGHSELERNNILENLMVKRKEKKLFKLQSDNTLTDKKTSIPRHITPILISRGKHFEGNDNDDGLETPSSTFPAVPRSPYDIPYDPGEERPNLTGGSFHQEFKIDPKDMPLNEHESIDLGSYFSSEGKQEHGSFHHNPYYNSGRKHHDRLAYQRFRRLQDRGSHDRLIDQLMYNEGGQIGFKAPNSLEKGKEIITYKEDGKCKNVMAHMKDEKMENAHETKSIADHTSEPSLIPNNSNVETSSVSIKPEQRFSLPQGEVINFPISTTATATAIIANANEHENILSLLKRHENVFLHDRRIHHTPTYSIASDLQVEVSEVGSPASTVDENGETNSNTDRESILYDGDIDKDRDASSGSEELWGTSFHGRQNTHRVSEEDIAGANNESKDTTLADALRQVDEENVADVSSVSSRCDVHEDNSTHARSSDRRNIFAYMNYSMGESEAPQSSNPSSSVSSPQKQLVDNHVEYLPTETQSQISELWSNMSENLIEGPHDINDLNNLPAIEQETIENSRSNNGDPSTLFTRQELIDDTSIFSVASSPRSVLPEKTMGDEEVFPLVYDQQITSSQESNNIEDMVQETSNSDQLSHDTMLQQNQVLMDDITNESHNIDLNHSQGQTNQPENCMEGVLVYMNDAEVSKRENEDMSKNPKNSQEENSTNLNRQEAIAESSNQARETSMHNRMTEIKRPLVDDKVQSTNLLVEHNNDDKPEDGETHEATISNNEANEKLPKDT